MDELIVPLQEKKSLLSKIKAHKTNFILIIIGFIILLSLTFYLVSPFKNSLFSPAEDENLAIPTLAPVRAPTKSALAVPTLSSTTPTPDPQVKDWQTYTNATYGYRVKYPVDWTASDLGQLEPKVPSYIVFKTKTATTSARYITISTSTRTYSEQLALAASGSAITVAGISGTKQSFQDSDGNTSTVVTLQRDNNLLVLRSKTPYLSTFNLMLTTLKLDN